MALRVGSTGPLVKAWQETMVRRFRSYAKAADGTTLKADSYFGFDDRDVQKEYQRRTNQGQTGEVSDQDLVALGLIQPTPRDTRPMLFTVCGTGVPWWVGPDADTARAVESKWKWQPIGYPAAMFPMGPSVANGREELCHQIELWRFEIEQFRQHKIALAGYSQGATVTSECWEFDIKPPKGRLHWAHDYMVKAVTWGNPMREKGKAWPDPGAPIANPNSHGIADRLMENTPDWWRNYAHHSDLYTECEGESGEDKTAIYKIVMGTRMLAGPNSIVAQLVEAGVNPLSGGLGIVKAVLDAGLFFGRQTGPHVNYDIVPAIAYLLS